ncbi:TerB family tellurite resistance protein [Cucumibacter marinus]|uniref:TerB family tellurite resistance protein n=1 Tax=Cucumibacter marinus TaxID=1121252 RepID=UPI00055BBDE1|nr:DnaJ family molecular chaperone [Cucumibacter marinus]
MSVWDRIVELGGSLASLFDPDSWLPGGRDAAFTLALVSLSAKMAAADGVVTADEIRAFAETVDIPAGAERQIERMFDLAQGDVAGFEHYARKVARLFEGRPETLEHVLDGLFHIAAADGIIHEDELAYLKTVSDIFGFDELRFEHIAAQHVLGQGEKDPYLVLGLDPRAPDDEVKRVYRLLAAEHHPDRLAARGVPEELTSMMSRKMAAINAAYERIKEIRGL